MDKFDGQLSVTPTAYASMVIAYLLEILDCPPFPFPRLDNDFANELLQAIFG